MVRKFLSKLFGIKTLDSYKKSCIIKPKYVKR